MKTEEILRRAAEYRSVREALGVYLVDLAGPGVEAGPDHPAGGPPPPASVVREPVSEEDASLRLDRRVGSGGAGWESGDG